MIWYKLLRAKGHLWHKSSMIKGIVPRSGIDMQMMQDGDSVTSRDGYLVINSIYNIKYWFSYNTSLSADFTQADVQKIIRYILQ